jgi:hypothetical protein
MRTQTAAQQRIRRLYHYQPFDLTRLTRTIVERTIYCSNPAHFNDPWDCKPCFSKSFLDDTSKYDQIVQWFVDVGRKHNPLVEEDEHRRRAAILQSNRGLLERMVAEATRGLEKAIAKQYRVYCLSTHPDAPLMWSHYAHSHQGICLEFSVQNELICAALPVQYRDTYPLFNLADDDVDASLEVLLTKSDIWTYESEYRLIAAAPGYRAPGVLPTKDNHLKVPAGSLISVILGCSMPNEQRALVRSLIQDAGQGIALLSAQRVPDRYAIQISRE